MRKYYFAIDIGGTNIKSGVVDENNDILCEMLCKTEDYLVDNLLAECVLKVIKDLEEKSKFLISNSSGLGIGIPGVIDKATGKIIKAVNLHICNQDFIEKLKSEVTVPIKIANDADIATLAEQKLGAGKDISNFIMVTLGTGIGGGIVLGGKNLGLEFGLPFEVGHLKIFGNQNKCTCGEVGCYETIGSTKVLVNELKSALSKNLTSAIWKKYNLSNIDGKTIFEFPKDYTAKEVLKQYIKNVASGLISLVNIFKSEQIVIGGAISKQKENLVEPLEICVNKHNFFKQTGYHVKIVPAMLGNTAGIVGAKLLFD